MGCAGIKSMEREMSDDMRKKSHSIRTLQMGMSIVCYLEGRTIKGPTGEIPFQVRIGLHSGRVIAGVVGSHKPQFSLIGDTVNTTARMCALSSPNTIQISQPFYTRVSHLSTFCHFNPRTIPVFIYYILYSLIGPWEGTNEYLFCSL